MPDGDQVAAHEQILVAIRVGIEEARPDTPPRSTHSGTGRPVRERAVAVVPEQHVLPESRDVDVRKAVGVDIADGSALPEAEVVTPAAAVTSSNVPSPRFRYSVLV